MPFVADLHIHSRFSRATSRDLDLERLHVTAQRKGVTVVGTGDLTHPGWQAELRERLVPAEPGLFRLEDGRARALDADVPPSCRRPVRFLLSGEISNIYKRAGADGETRVRKVHNVVLAPSFEVMARLTDALGRVGNLKSDGRPILGLDSRDLLEIVLEAGGLLIPAHVWTPWFSALGAKSGFDTIGECYADLADHIFAVETGLSSDPPMNWRVSGLDRFTLVSNSDAHSPDRLGREANRFDCELSYDALIDALRTRRGFLGTLEFYPEEGKYHLDGHRACGVRLEPAETALHGGRCPGCGRPLTVGVLHRVEQLADRPEGTRPDGAAGFESLVALAEVLAEVHGVGPASKTVARSLEPLLHAFGPELHVLREVPPEDIARVSSPLVAEAVRRARSGEVRVDAGYDGEYGTVRIFGPDERKELSSQAALFARALAAGPATAGPATAGPATAGPATVPAPGAAPPAGQLALFGAASIDPSLALLDGLDDAQQAAVSAPAGPVLIVAGPGTGKTRTLTHRLAWRVLRGEVRAPHGLAITFTNKAADELRERLEALLGRRAAGLTVGTFHAVGLRLLDAERGAAGLPEGFVVAGADERLALLDALDGVPLPRSRRERERLLDEVSRSKQSLDGAALLTPTLRRVREAYDVALRAAGAVDLDDLVLLPTALLRDDPAARQRARDRWRALFVDEYQDVNPVQADFVRLLAGPVRDITAIGDPDQAIYGFRGADVALFHRFPQDYPGTRALRLDRSYRTAAAVLAPARAVLGADAAPGDLWSAIEGGLRVRLIEAATERAEAEQVVHAVERLVGGTGFFSLDSARVAAGEDGAALTFGDVAVLYRTRAQAPALVEAFARSGVPFQTVGEAGPFEGPALRAALGVLRLVVAPGNTAARAALPPLGPKKAARRDAAIDALRETTGGPAATARALSAPDLSLGLDEAALAPLVTLAEGCADLREVVARAALRAEQDAFDPRAERVALLTLHASKGLEFPVVFVVGCEDGLLPFRREREEPTPARIAEERRLLYVGMTRAKRELVLLHARSRALFGRRDERRPSPFVTEIAAELLARERAGAGAPQKKPAATDVQLTLF